ncbi:MAG: hypothetical protein AMXMBFR46_24490 [Acidimicrobiia bacterium]
MTPDPFTDPDTADGESLDDGGTWLLDLVAAVDHLRRGHRPDLRVWDALEEAIRWSLTPDDEDIWLAADPLAAGLRKLLEPADEDAPLDGNDEPDRIATAIQTAVRHWLHATATAYNNGHHWPHPHPRRGFPPPRLDPIALTDR